MRISDWSSDVCSSDLPGRRLHHQPPAARRPHGLRALARRHLHRAAAEGRVAAAEGALGVDAEHRELVGGTAARLALRDAAPKPLGVGSSGCSSFYMIDLMLRACEPIGALAGAEDSTIGSAHV